MPSLLLIDANSFIHRAFHALPPLTGPSGKPTGALYGLTNTLLKIIQDEKPNYIAAAFDRPEPTFRKEMYEDYKAHRPKAPGELISQIKDARALFQNIGIPTFETPGLEADDIIGALAKKFASETKVIILTGDLDALQIVQGDRIIVKIPRKGLSDIVEYNQEAVENRFGLKPQNIPDFKGLVGETSDNIPGIPGVGPKTAEKLLQEFGTLENLCKKIKPVSSLNKKIISFKNQAILSKKLATIKTDAPPETNLENLRYRKPESKKLAEYLASLGFHSIVKRLENAKTEKTPSAPESQNQKKGVAGKLPENAVIFPDLVFCEKNPDLLSSTKIKIAYDWKEIMKSLKGKKTITPPLFDLKIASWLLSPDGGDFSLEALTRKFLEKHFKENDKSLILKELYLEISEKIKKENLDKVLDEIEMPLIPILADMETSGIGVNKEKLAELSASLGKETLRLTEEIYNLTGENFNLNSPKQIAEVLFEKLKIAPQKRTKTGQKSTSEDILSSLSESHPVIPLILEYRETFKIQSTYIIPLLKLLKNNEKIHTTFIQTGTATGRLASEKPNLQNIPQLSKWASLLRSSFETAPRTHLASFDYSQLELRLLAHLSEDENLLNAFKNGEDIHRLTASNIFKIPIDKITPDMRRLGKTLNFGIIYGMGSRALGKAANISQKEAQIFIREYFASFPKIKEWQEKTITAAKFHGFVENLNGRRRWFQKTSHPRYLGEIERMAVNMPIQGLNADIIKLAMIKTNEFFIKNGWREKAKIILSIHDELLFEVADDILKECLPKIRKIMENALPIAAPLKVEMKTGKNWGSMEPNQE